MKEIIYREYRDKVAGYIHSRINNCEDAEDLVSTVFLKIYAKWDTFDSKKSSISTWIYTITANTVKDYYKVHKIYDELPKEMPSDEAIDAELLSKETLQELADALNSLSERERDLIVLHYYQNIQLKTIAEMMHMSYAYAKVVHKAALRKLETKLKKLQCQNSLALMESMSY